MRSVKAQGVSLNFIVLAIIAALVLVIIVSFSVGGLGGSLSSIFKTGEEATKGSNVDIAKSTCNSYCGNAEGSEPSMWKGSNYCSKTFTVEEEQIHCWDSPINVQCSASGQDVYDEVWECSEDNCEEEGCPEIRCIDNLDDNVECSGLSYNECSEYIPKGNCSWSQL